MDCPNGNLHIKMANSNHKDYNEPNAQKDKTQPNKRFRVCVVTVTYGAGEGVISDAPGTIVDGADYFTAPLKHGAEYAMQTAGRRVIVVDSGASKCLFRRKGMFKRYIAEVNTFVHTANGEAIPVIRCGTVGDIPDCLHVPTLEKDLLSVPHFGAAMGWRTTLGKENVSLRMQTRALSSTLVC